MFKLYKYKSFTKFTENIITNSSLYFASPHDFNDPFDCQFSFRETYSRKEIRDYFILFLKNNPNKNISLKKLLTKYGKTKSFIEYMETLTSNFISHTGILSLSKNYKNILMWSHYSDDHKGLVFEFTPFHEDENLIYPTTIPINYVKSYTPLSYCKTPKENFQNIFGTKHADWAYEEEYRSLDFNSPGKKVFPKKLLTTIFFGLHAKTSNIKNIIQLCKENGFEHVKFKKAQKIPGKFALEFIDIT